MANCIFEKELISKVMDIYGEEQVEVTIQDCNKNGVTLRGLSIRKPDVNVAPVIYLEQFEEKYEAGESIDNIAGDIIKISEAHAVGSNFDVVNSMRMENTVLSVCNKKNAEKLGDVPYRVVCDELIAYPKVVVECGDSNGTITLSYSVLESLGWDEQQVFEMGLENTKRVSTMGSMVEVLGNMLDEELIPPLDGPMMYVLSNKDRINGASVLACDAVLNQVADKLSSDLILLPSSIHEILAIPYEPGMDISMFQQMVLEVNSTQVAPTEFLSNCVFFYERGAGLKNLGAAEVA